MESNQPAGSLSSPPSSPSIPGQTVSSRRTGEYEAISEDGMRSSLSLINHFVDQGPIQTDLERGVAYLQQVGHCGTSVYEHLRTIIKKILETRPENVIDFFEEYSRQIRADNYYQRPESFIEPWISARSIEYAKLQMSNFKLFVSTEPTGSNIPEEGAYKGSDDGEGPPDEIKNYEELLHYILPQVGLGFPKKSTLAFVFAMKKLEQIPGLENCRFWGKIFGLKKDYFIAEANLTDEERERRLLEIENENEQESEEVELLPTDLGPAQSAVTLKLLDEAIEDEHSEFHFAYVMPPLPVAKFKKPVEIKAEEPGTGANKKTYFVCHELGENWIELPDVTPTQIIVARQITCYFTGDLDTPMNTFPAFPGKEINYLRAQIARISASCHISPQGLYMLVEDDDDDDDDEDTKVKTNYVLDEEFEGQSLLNLLEPNMEYWCHHSNELLKQGRVNWWNPKSAVEGEEEAEEEEDEEEEEEEKVEEEPEVGKQLLTAVAEDVFDDLTPAWNVKSSSVVDETKAMAIATSNIWPGAYAFARERRSENIYFGWGQKHLVRGFTPFQIPLYQSQFLWGDNLLEQDDPTPEQEEDYRQSLIKPVSEEMEEEENEEEAEEEESD
ncbi:radial spoke head protein 6 homolog A [Diaphorina citri]|uniref:Radial spoke head protein 6 homolog A n=1 Tax=Diaphorina citri TaxID=121845 RepID=A0A1S3D3V4_DIACI|nr:radial spoke head protein 6 homolog A [Diaphorina citri]KAI5706272.1 hypothetical protein M8J75_006487 [Diaphorina citri]KAI5740277.1 hypothetical protein M8J76_002343 [Diaphorina citri]KAI5746443.1 hypothetical protein M8J77_003598 [Diaphorina citri]